MWHDSFAGAILLYFIVYFIENKHKNKYVVYVHLKCKQTLLAFIACINITNNYYCVILEWLSVCNQGPAIYSGI